MADCRYCGSPAPAGGRFCPECGRPLEGAPPAPGALALWPPDPLVLLAALLAIGAIILLASGTWAWGVVVLLVAVILLLVWRRNGLPSLQLVRERAQAVGETVALRSRGQIEVFRARRELAELAAERGGLFRELGRAVFENDETGTTEARSALEAVAERIREKEAEIETLIRQTEERVQRAQAPIAPTERMEMPPEPARVPEPWPPPDEGDIPPPAPPEPSPGEPTPAPEHPPMPQTGAGRDS